MKTRTIDGAGKTPKWEQSFSIKVPDQQDVIKFTVKDQDVTGSDLVGEESYKFAQLIKETGYEDWLPINYKGKQAGQIHIKTTWYPEKPDDDESESEDEEEKAKTKGEAAQTAAGPP